MDKVNDSISRLLAIALFLATGMFITSIVFLGHMSSAFDTQFFSTDGLLPYSPDETNYPDKDPAIVHLELAHKNACTAFVIDANYLDRRPITMFRT